MARYLMQYLTYISPLPRIRATGGDVAIRNPKVQKCVPVPMPVPVPGNSIASIDSIVYTVCNVKLAQIWRNLSKISDLRQQIRLRVTEGRASKS